MNQFRFVSNKSGQSLAELAMIFPILLLVLIGGASFGMGLYQANVASGAIQQPALKKLEMADDPNPISPGQVLGWVKQDGTKGNLTKNAIDTVTFVNNDPNIALVVGTKQYKNIAPFLPNMDITVVQGLNKSLLLAANNGARIRSATSGWVPGGSPRVPPWKNPILGQNVPPDLPLNPGCARVPVGENIIEGINDDPTSPKVYISRTPVASFSPVTPASLMQMAQDFAGACANEGAGVCAGEEKNLEPQPKPNEMAEPIGKTPGGFGTEIVYTFQTTNPPGGPGTILKYTVTCDKEGAGARCKNAELLSVEPNPAVGPNHGMYVDPSEKYEYPPPGPGGADFIKSCMSRKKAECMMKKAIEKGNSILSAYPDACP